MVAEKNPKNIFVLSLLNFPGKKVKSYQKKANHELDKIKVDKIVFHLILVSYLTSSNRKKKQKRFIASEATDKKAINIDNIKLKISRFH